MNMTLKPAFGLSGSALKVIAMISMVIDHVALYLMEHGTVLYETMRCVGRIAFPVFAFLITEGFIHTRSRYRYFFTLLGFAVISEIPWYLLNGADGTHNVMFTLALGVATLMVLENLLQRSMVLGFLWTLGMAGLASWLGVDYEWRGIIVIDIFYLYNIRKHSVNHVFSSPTSIINFTSKKPSYDDTRRSGRDNELLQRAQNDL